MSNESQLLHCRQKILKFPQIKPNKIEKKVSFFSTRLVRNKTSNMNHAAVDNDEKLGRLAILFG